MGKYPLGFSMNFSLEYIYNCLYLHSEGAGVSMDPHLVSQSTYDVMYGIDEEGMF